MYAIFETFDSERFGVVYMTIKVTQGHWECRYLINIGYDFLLALCCKFEGHSRISFGLVCPFNVCNCLSFDINSN